MVLTLNSASPYSPTHNNSIYQQHGRETQANNLESQTQHRTALLGRLSIAGEDETDATEYNHATSSQQTNSLHHHSNEPAGHSPVATKNIQVAHSQYSHHSLAHNNYDAFYTSSAANSAVNSPLVISSGQIINGHTTPTVVQYAAPNQHHVSINN